MNTTSGVKQNPWFVTTLPLYRMSEPPSKYLVAPSILNGEIVECKVEQLAGSSPATYYLLIREMSKWGSPNLEIAGFAGRLRDETFIKEPFRASLSLTEFQLPTGSIQFLEMNQEEAS